MRGKKLTTMFFALSLWMSPLLISAQNFANFIPTAIESASIKDISRHFDKRVQVSIDRESGSYSTTQAEIIIKNFLDELGRREYRLLHSASENGGETKILIGEIKSAKGSYKTYIYIRKMGANEWIQEMRFDKM